MITPLPCRDTGRQQQGNQQQSLTTFSDVAAARAREAPAPAGAHNARQLQDASKVQYPRPP